MGWAELRRAISDDRSNTANWSDDTSEVEVTQQKGFMCNVKARGRLRMEPDKVFDILISPDNYRYFSGIKVCIRHQLLIQQSAAAGPVIKPPKLCWHLQRIDYRKVLEDNGAGKIKIEVQQVCRATCASPLVCCMTSVFHIHTTVTFRHLCWQLGILCMFQLVHDACRLGNGSSWAFLGSLQQHCMFTKTKKLAKYALCL